MDPVSLIVAAVVTGAAAGLKEQAQMAVRDAYQALKRLIFQRHGIDVEPVERKPGSKPKQDSLHEDLAEHDVGADAAVLAAAQQVVDEARKDNAAAAAARAVGVDLDHVTAEFIRIADVNVHGHAIGADLDDVHARGGIVIEGVKVDGGDAPHP